MSTASHAYVRCRVCGHRVYHGARRCTYCNRRMRRSLGIWIIGVIIAILISIALAEWLANDTGPGTAATLENQ